MAVVETYPMDTLLGSVRWSPPRKRFLRSNKRFKDGKQHRYWSVVENRRVTGGRSVQKTLLYLDTFWQPLLPDSQKDTPWLKVLKTLVANRLLEPGSEWKLHTSWFDRSAMADLLDDDFRLAAIDTLYRCHDHLLEKISTRYGKERRTMDHGSRHPHRRNPRSNAPSQSHRKLPRRHSQRSPNNTGKTPRHQSLATRQRRRPCQTPTPRRQTLSVSPQPVPPQQGKRHAAQKTWEPTGHASKNSKSATNSPATNCSSPSAPPNNKGTQRPPSHPPPSSRPRRTHHRRHLPPRSGSPKTQNHPPNSGTPPSTSCGSKKASAPSKATSDHGPSLTSAPKPTFSSVSSPTARTTPARNHLYHRA